MVIQSVLIPRDRFNLNEAKKWLRRHDFISNYKGKPVHITKNYYRFRQTKPLKNAKYSILPLNDGVLFVLMN